MLSKNNTTYQKSDCAHLLSQIQSLLSMDQIIEGDYLLYNGQDQRFYSPTKTSIIYKYIAYGFLFSTDISFDFLVKISDKLCFTLNVFMISDYYQKDIDELQIMIAKCLELITDFTTVVTTCFNSHLLLKPWSTNSSLLQNRLILTNTKLTQLSVLTHENRTRLVEFFEKYDRQNYAFDRWILTNYSELCAVGREIFFLNNTQNLPCTIDIIFLTKIECIKYRAMIRPEFNKILESKTLSDENHRHEIASFIEFYDGLPKDFREIGNTTDDAINFVRKLLDPVTKQRIILDIVMLRNIDYIELATNTTSYLHDTELKDAVSKYEKYKGKGYIDKHGNIRPVNRVMYKDFEKFTADNLVLTSSQIDIINTISQRSPDLKYYEESCNRVFTIGSIPNIIFKMINDDKKFVSRCRNHIFARQICKYYGFDLLKVPNFGYIRESKIIFEELFDICDKHSSQELLYDKYASKMHNTIKQLTQFCCLTGLGDVVWRNIPLLNTSLDKPNVVIGLVDLGEMSYYHESIFGGCGNRIGLVRCVDSSLFQIIRDQVYEMTGYKYTASFDNKEKTRCAEIEFTNAMYQYYKYHKIVGTEHISIPALAAKNTLFDKYTPDEQIILNQLLIDVVDLINTKLDNRSVTDGNSLKFIRRIQLTGHDRTIRSRMFNEIEVSLIDTDNENNSYMYYVLKTLESLGCIYKIIDPKRYILQV